MPVLFAHITGSEAAKAAAALACSNGMATRGQDAIDTLGLNDTADALARRCMR
jgi:hypothetical protein